MTTLSHTPIIRRALHIIQRRDLSIARVPSAPIAPTGPDWSLIDDLLSTPLGKREQQQIKLRILKEGKYTFDKIEADSFKRSAAEWFVSLYVNEEAVTRLTLELDACHPTADQAARWGQNDDYSGFDEHWAQFRPIADALATAKSNVDLAKVCLAFIRIRDRRAAGENL